MTATPERVVRAVLDTSIFVAQESGRPLEVERLPANGYVTAITLAELEAGVLAASDVRIRAQRLRTLTGIAAVDVLGVAATALAHNLPVMTQDDGFDPLADLGELVVIHA